MEQTKEKMSQLDKEKFVYEKVDEILQKDYMDKHVITNIDFAYRGICIIVTISGLVSADTIIAISKTFGDRSPNVYAVGNNLLRLTFSNIKYDALKD